MEVMKQWKHRCVCYTCDVIQCDVIQCDVIQRDVIQCDVQFSHFGALFLLMFYSVFLLDTAWRQCWFLSTHKGLWNSSPENSSQSENQFDKENGSKTS